MLSSADGSERRAGRFMDLLGIIIAGFCSFLCLYATQPLLPLLSQIFHASKAQVSLTVSATTAAVALAAPFIGVLADMLGRKRVIVPSLFAMAATTLLAATATDLHALVLFRFLQGLCMPGAFAVTIAYITEEWADRGVGRAMAAYVTGTVVGGFSGRLIAGTAASRGNWRASFLALGVVTLIGCCATWLWLPRSTRFIRTRAPLQALRAMRGHLRNPLLLATYAIGFNVLFSLVSTFTYVTFYLAAPPFHLSPAALSWLFTVYLLGMFVTPIAGAWIDRFGSRRVVSVALHAAVLGIVLTLAPFLPSVVIGLALVSSAVFICQSASTSFLRLAAPAESRSSAAGLYVCFYYLGGSAGGLIPSALWNFGGWPVCVLLIAGVQLITAQIALRRWPDQHKADSLPSMAT